jgi:hypothetical protein
MLEGKGDSHLETNKLTRLYLRDCWLPSVFFGYTRKADDQDLKYMCSILLSMRWTYLCETVQTTRWRSKIDDSFSSPDLCHVVYVKSYWWRVPTWEKERDGKILCLKSGGDSFSTNVRDHNKERTWKKIEKKEYYHYYIRYFTFSYILQGHFLGNDIQEKIRILEQRYYLLNETWSNRRILYEQNLDTQVRLLAECNLIVQYSVYSVLTVFYRSSNEKRNNWKIGFCRENLCCTTRNSETLFTKSKNWYENTTILRKLSKRKKKSVTLWNVSHWWVEIVLNSYFPGNF